MIDLILELARMWLKNLGKIFVGVATLIGWMSSLIALPCLALLMILVFLFLGISAWLKPARP